MSSRNRGYSERKSSEHKRSNRSTRGKRLPSINASPRGSSPSSRQLSQTVGSRVKPINTKAANSNPLSSSYSSITSSYKWQAGDSPSPSRSSYSPHKRRSPGPRLRSIAAPPPQKQAEDAWTIQPKVFVPIEPVPGHTPREAVIQRQKRLYQSQDIASLLEAAGVAAEPPADQIAPSSVGSGALMSLLPLGLFDNSDFDMFSPQEWVAKSTPPDGSPPAIPARAQHPNPSLGWVDCVVTGYDETLSKFRVTWSDGGASGVPSSSVARLQLCFNAEDPFAFARRVAAAHMCRQRAEAQIRYNLYVDCMPTDGLGFLDQQQIGRIIDTALSTPALRRSNADTSALLNEVGTDYVRAMNKLLFDASLSQPGNRAVFHSLSLPPPPPQLPPPYLGVIVCPPHDFGGDFTAFARATFLTQPEVIMLMLRVREECNRVLPQRAFNTAHSRSLQLEEFRTVQSSSCKALTRLLTDGWSMKVTAAIKGALTGAVASWYNVNETQRAAYEGSKLRQLLTRVNFMMEVRPTPHRRQPARVHRVHPRVQHRGSDDREHR